MLLFDYIQKLDFSSLYEYFESPYPEIQSLALNIVAEIIGRNKNEDIQSLFRKTNGIKILLNFLEVRYSCFYE